MKDLKIFLILLVIGLIALYLLRDYWWFDPRTPLPQETQTEQTNPVKATAANTNSKSTFGLPPTEASNDNTNTANSISYPEDQEIAAPDLEPIVDDIVDEPSDIDLNHDDDTDTITDIAATQITEPQSPASFIQQYYNNLKHVPYEETWAMLSPDFQAQSSFDKYVRWWSKSVDTVSVEEVTTLSENRVSVVLHYRMKNGKKVCSEDTFTLEAIGNTWQIDKQKYKNC